MARSSSILIFLVLLPVGALASGCASEVRIAGEKPEIVAGDARPASRVPLEPDEVVRRAERAVVYIEVAPQGRGAVTDLWRELAGGGSVVFGSGFAVTAEGHVVTNAHVVGAAERVRVIARDGRSSWARVVAVDPARDLALVRLELGADERLSPDEVVPLGRSSELRLGQKIVVYGYPGRPWPQSGPPRPTVTTGVVSSLGIDVGERAPRFQVDAAVNSGSSGGPVLDDRGRVVGVVTEASDPARFASQAFAIPIDDVAAALFQKSESNPVVAGK